MHDHASSNLHARIRAEVEARILSGELKPGDRIPTETEMMARYGCSRMTVNKAMASLAATGLIVRNRRAGTSVARPKMHAGVLTIPDIRADIEARGGLATKPSSMNCARPLHLGSKDIIWAKAASSARSITQMTVPC